MTSRVIVIVGAGPLATYAMSHLGAVLPEVSHDIQVRLAIFDRGGRFGAGNVHSDLQARTSYMNRVAAQIAFAADESNQAATRLLPRCLRPTFLEWCQERFARTGDPCADLEPHHVPRRYLHGIALRELFRRYVDRLRSLPNVSVDLYEAEVTDVVRSGRNDPPFIVRTGHPEARALGAHHILFVTGHSSNQPAGTGGTADGVVGVADPYPLDQRVTKETAPSGAVVGVNGLGLTAIDVILHLTEGRGGRFKDFGDGLQYARSGREPAVIVAVSPSGVPVSGRAVNQKLADPAGTQHRAVFFTTHAIGRLRGCDDVARTGSRGRLDFSRHLLPLIALEMAYVYYLTLLGPRFADQVRTLVDERYQSFLESRAPWSTAGADFLIEPVQDAFDRAARTITSPPGADDLERTYLIDAFRRVLYGAPEDGPAAGSPSPWGHSLDIRAHRFDWRQALEPVRAEAGRLGPAWSEQVIAYLRRDIAYCAQGNFANPLKAACDGVFRDLRTEFTVAVDCGGLTPESQREFAERYLRYYNRLSNGACLLPMRKFVALVEAGLVDLSVGPGARILPGGDDRFEIVGPVTGVTRMADVLIDARIHPFDPDNDVAPLYRNLLGNGLVRQWRNPGVRQGEADLVPGGLDLDDGFHPRTASGWVDSRLTFLGAPAEGLRLFQLSVARPQSDSYVLNNVVRWAEELVTMLPAAGAGQARRPAMPSASARSAAS